MTVVYVPRLIESAEQAEALPLGTVSIDFDSQGQPYQASIRVRGGWYCTGEVAADGSPWLAPHDAMTGDTALVPIEAEEEAVQPLSSTAMAADGFSYGPDDEIPEEYFDGPPRTRYVTPWESV